MEVKLNDVVIKIKVKKHYDPLTQKMVETEDRGTQQYQLIDFIEADKLPYDIMKERHNIYMTKHASFENNTKTYPRGLYIELNKKGRPKRKLQSNLRLLVGKVEIVKDHIKPIEQETPILDFPDKGLVLLSKTDVINPKLLDNGKYSFERNGFSYTNIEINGISVKAMDEFSKVLVFIK